MYGSKLIAKLTQKKYRQEYECFVVDGKKGVMDALSSEVEVFQIMISDRFMATQTEFVQQPQIQSFFESDSALVIPEEAFDRAVESSTPQGVAVLVRLPHHEREIFASMKTIAILDDIRDPGNLGTMIRTADWFGLDGIILIGGADPYQPKVVRASMGSIFHLPIFQSKNTHEDVTFLKDHGFEIVVTRPESTATPQFNAKSSRTCFVFGNESVGTSEELDSLADSTLTLPKFGKAESLNVAVSFGIVLADHARQTVS